MATQLPETGFLRLHQVIGRAATDKKPAVPAIYPVSRSAWWEGVRTQRYPAAVKLGPRTTAWRVEDIRALIDGAASAKAA